MPRKRTAALLVAAFAIFAVIDVCAFRTGLYHAVLDPSSSTGSFESAIAQSAVFRGDPRRDVLVLGDSRIYSGLDPAAASAAGGRLRFLNGGVPGTTPRCWPFFVRAIDPQARRFRAVVIAVDTYADDDTAIGSLDGDDRPMDLRYVVFQTRLTDLPKLAGSFSDPRERVENGIDLFWRGQELRDDVQALVADPLARIRALDRARSDPAYDPLAAHPRSESLAGLRVDFATNTIVYPASISDSARGAIATQVLAIAKPSPSYARYRREWLAPIAARYAATGTPVFFVRIPTRPAHREASQTPSGSLLEIAAQDRARLIDATPYLALERPDLFADEDHLNASGSLRFSRLLGADVARLLADAPPSASRAATAARPAASAAQPGTPPPQEHHSLSWFAAACGIGIPLRFQSYEFWLFFAIVAALFYCLPRRYGRIVLLIVSYYFYARWNAWYVLFLWILTASDFVIAIWIEDAKERQRRSIRLLLGLGVTANLAFLATFKYANTFQSISYLVDVYRGRTAAVRKPLNYALYLAFFPQLLAGPIVRAGLFFGELFNWRPPGPDDLTYGLARASFGLVKKTAIADQFASVANAYFDGVASHPGAPAAWSALFAFSMQIYFDFSGYSDIAIGCARMLGFVFPENFRMPYLATSITDFWHRWHITLSTWLRDYLYVPLGGNRHGALATLRNLMITMLLGGLWHGAQWTFVAWGGFHGVMLCVERVFGIGRADKPRKALALAARVTLTFFLVTLAWVLFRSPSFGVAVSVYRALFAGGPGATLLLTGWQTLLAAGIVAFGTVRLVLERRNVVLSWQQLRPSLQVGALAGLLVALQLFSWSGVSPTFIYFKF
jgi:D-alanyl-lipoteichoic acid acyltransferase DltB (MBOAT superfamily)